MTLATMTTEGQITIPKEIRESLQLQAGDTIDFFIKESGETVIRPMSKKVDDVFCKLKNTKTNAISVEDMDRAIQNRFKENYNERRCLPSSSA